MNIAFENQDAVSARLTVKIEAADYAEAVSKSLKNIKQKANVPGFRPGKAPMGMIQKFYGAQVKVEEVNRLLGETVSNYIKENNLQVLGEPLPVENAERYHAEETDTFECSFDLALEPQIEVALSADDKVPYYNIAIDDDTVAKAVENYQRNQGTYSEADMYEQERDLIRGSMAELGEDGQPKEDGIKVENVSLMPNYFKNEAQKDIFLKEGKKGATLTFNPSVAYDGNEAEVSSMLKIKKEEVAEHTGDFAYTIDSISRFTPAELNEELFKKVFGDECTTEEDFRARIKADLAAAYERDSDYKFLMDLRDYVEEKVGDVQFPEALIKRMILQTLTKEEDIQNIDNILANEVKGLRWMLTRNKLAKALDAKVDDAAYKATAIEMVKIQMSQYGINNLPDDVAEEYAKKWFTEAKAQEQILDRALDRAITAAAKQTVTLSKKKTTIEKFNKMFQN